MLATKFGLVPHADGKGADVDGSPEHVRSACEASLKRLQTDYIDLYYQHRVDRKVGVETTVREMKASLDYHSHSHIQQMTTILMSFAVLPIHSDNRTLIYPCCHLLLAIAC